MKTAGVVLDFYDDMTGALLKESFPTPESLPEIVKEAHILSPEERDVLRDDAYALVLVNEGKILRKFACVDAGNTLLSAMYFMQNKESLPVEAQKIASANIEAACEVFGLPLRDIEKIAASHRGMNPRGTTKGAARTRDSMLEPIAGDESNWAERTNLTSVSGGQDAGRVGSTAGQMKTAHYQDSMDANGYRQGNNGPYRNEKEWAEIQARRKEVNTTEKVADFADEHGVPDDKPSEKKSKKKGDINLDSFHRLNPKAKPPAKKEKDANGDCAPMPKMANVIDVSGLEAPLLVKKASANHLALGRYPLDSYNDVKKAVEFFDENYLQMTPEDRHSFAVKTAERADDLGIAFGHMLERYGSVEYSLDVEAHLASRRALAPDFKETWNDLREKKASVSPDEFVKLLEDADKKASLNWEYGGEVQDAYYATFGGNRVKEAHVAWDWHSPEGTIVNADQLKKLALNGHGIMKKQFDGDLARAFAKDPIAIFESLPTTHKTIISRLANQEFDGLPNN